MAPNLTSERQPLLHPAITTGRSDRNTPVLHEPAINKSYLTGDDIPSPDYEPSRAVEDDVLPETSPLGRTLSRRSVYLLIISRVIGSGIFATPGAILRAVGSPGLALLLWVLGAVVAACALSIGLEYGCMLPRSGGEKVYLEFTYRRPKFLASTLIATAVVLLGFTASNCIVFSEYVLFTLAREDAPEFLRKGLAVGLLTAVTVIHGVFPKTGVRLQNLLGYVKIGTIVFMILCGLYVVVLGPSAISASTDNQSSAGRRLFAWEDRIWTGSVWNWGVIATSLFKVTYSFAGLENANNVLNEVKDPVRTLRFATRAALATACFMYILVNLAYLAVVPLDDIKASGELIAALYFERLFGPQVGRVVLPLAVALSAAGNVLVVAFSLSRVKQEVARQGLLPFGNVLSSTRPFGSPLGGLLMNFVVSVLVLVLPPSKEVYSFILEVESYPGQFFALASACGLLYLRRKKPDLKRPFRAWIPAVVLRIMVCLALIAAPFFPPATPTEGGMFYATYAVVGFSIIMIGLVYWFAWTILAPRLGGYKLEEKAEVLADGMTVTKYVHVPTR
ncbi:low-affinity methionine permease [Pyricularia oryzae]